MISSVDERKQLVDSNFDSIMRRLEEGGDSDLSAVARLNLAQGEYDGSLESLEKEKASITAISEEVRRKQAANNSAISDTNALLSKGHCVTPTERRLNNSNGEATGDSSGDTSPAAGSDDAKSDGS